MRLRFIILLAAFFAITYVGYQQITAQNLVTCPGLVQKAISSIGNNCGGLNRNSACYGFTDVQASFSVPQPANFFSAPSDRASLANLEDLNTSPMNQTNDKWGIALMSMQANLPDTLPGQNVVFMLLGDTQIENAVPPDQLAQPGKTVSVSLQIAGDLYYLPDFTAKKVGSVPQGTALTADAISSDGQWVRVAYGGIPGWLTKQVISTSGDLTTLSVISADTKTPVQAFYFRTGISGTDCNEAPNAMVVQGPKNLTVDIQANGADIRLGSTIALYLLPVDGMTQQYLTDHFGDIGAVSQLMQLIVLDGHVIINPGLPNETDLVTGQTSFTCLSDPQNLGDDGQPNDRTVFNRCNWAPPRQVTLADIEPYRFLQDLVLNYPIELPIDLPPMTPTMTFTPSETFTPGPTRTPSPTGAPTGTPTDTGTPPPQPTHHRSPTATPTACNPFTFPANIADGDNATLIAAIHAANDETCHPGTQTINLANGGTYTFSGADNTSATGQNALPVITSGIIIAGNGSKLQTGDPFGGRLIEISGSGNVSLSSITVNGDGAAINTLGGGIYNAGTLSTTGTYFTNNHATVSGGGLYNAGSATIVQTTFSGNGVGSGGSGIGNVGSLSLLNSTVAQNNTDGLKSDGGSMKIDFTTVADNGDYGLNVTAGTVTINNSILGGNDGNCNFTGGSVTGTGSNFDSDGSCGGAGNFVNAGNSLDLGNFDGTVVPIDAGSLAADTDDCMTSSGSSLDRDQVGTTRPQDLSTDVSTACDAGSFEVPSGGG